MAVVQLVRLVAGLRPHWQQLNAAAPGCAQVLSTAQHQQVEANDAVSFEMAPFCCLACRSLGLITCGTIHEVHMTCC